MMRSRSFMSGLGVGLIIGAALLQLMLVGERQANVIDTPSEVTLTREQLEEQAKELDLEVVDSSDQLMTEEQWKQLKLQEGAEPTGKSTEAPNAPSSPTKPKENDDELATTNIQSPKDPVVEPKNKVVVNYKIDKGRNLTEVAKGLEQVGVITDTNQFIKEASRQKVNTKIREGNYSFAKGESYQSIISKIRIESSR
ncbi:hypothetical protein [Paenibacillus sp. CMAA1364]